MKLRMSGLEGLPWRSGLRELSAFFPCSFSSPLLKRLLLHFLEVKFVAT